MVLMGEPQTPTLFLKIKIAFTFAYLYIEINFKFLKTVTENILHI
jgi:hypothetical protein